MRIGAQHSRAAAIVGAGLACAACAWQPREPGRFWTEGFWPREPKRAPAPKAATERVFGSSVEGRRLEARALGSGERTVLVLGAIHGSEPGSHELVRAFERAVAATPAALAGLRVVFCSPLNPDGLARGRRGNAQGVDLNRNFPARSFWPSPRHGPAPLSEPETRFLASLLRRWPPVLVITVHQPRRSVNWDGAAAGIARAMAEANGYRLEASVGYPTPGSLGSWLGVDLDLPVLTLELGRRPAPGRSFLDENREALRRALAIAATLPPSRPAGGGRPLRADGVSPGLSR